MPKDAPPGVLPNRFPHRCRHCGEWVAPGKGIIFRDRADRRWLGEHLACPETDGYGGFGDEDYPIFHD
jgi:hypothetical protein